MTCPRCLTVPTTGRVMVQEFDRKEGGKSYQPLRSKSISFCTHCKAIVTEELMDALTRAAGREP